YEGGHTMFGRWQLPAYVQEVTRLARDMLAGQPSESLSRSPTSRQPRPARRRYDEPYRCTGVATEPRETYRPGDVVSADFALTCATASGVISMPGCAVCTCI